MRLGISGANLIFPAANTLLDTVMTAARAAILPEGVSTATSRLLQEIRLAGVDSEIGTCSPSLAIRAPRPCRQANTELRSCARTLSTTENSFRSLPAKLAPSANSMVPPQGPTSFGKALAQDRSDLCAASSKA